MLAWGFEPGDVPRLLRQVYAAAMDEVMDVERRTAVLVRPMSVYANPADPPTAEGTGTATRSSD